MFSQLQWSLKMPIALLMPLFLAHRVQQRASSCFRQKLFKCQIYSVATKVLTTMTLALAILLLVIVACFLPVQCICNLGPFISLLPGCPSARNSFVFTHDRTGFVALGWPLVSQYQLR